MSQEEIVTAKQRLWFGALATLIGLAGFTYACGGLSRGDRTATASAGASQAGAESAIDGIVVGNADRTLTVETVQGLERVTLPANAKVTDSAGASLPITSLDIGRYVVCHCHPLAGGALEATQIEGRSASELESWCGDQSDMCMQLQAHVVAGCQIAPATCHALASPLSGIDQVLGNLTSQMQDLEGRCQQGTSQGCQAFETFCSSHAAMCQAIIENSSGQTATPDLEKQLAELMSGCGHQSGQCQEMMDFCSQHADICQGVRQRLQDLHGRFEMAGPPGRH